MNIQFQKVIEGLKRHAGMLDYGCWNSTGDDKDGELEYCPYFDADKKNMGCGRVLLRDAIELLDKYDEALKLMVEQYCTIPKKYYKGKDCDDPDKEVFFHAFMCAGEHAFKVLGIENGEEVTDEFIWS